ncbi:MAG TPA: glycosyltransferase family 4 protein [Kiritimatiellia bacterium]|nr:glycosyltransferase family 4 protein [Kiritimatiellia bacterium]HMO98669.1 glycosyltransferase family 4 protein [Kiritimatiellia bacterium]
MKIAYFCEPQVGGTFSFFTRIRPALSAKGIDFRCIPPITAERFAGSRFEGIEGVDYVTFPEDDLPRATRILIDHLSRKDYQAIMVLPGCDLVATNLVRYLPHSIRTTARIPMITRGTYAPTASLAGHLDAIFGVSDRVKDDLISRYGVSAEKITVVYNGVGVSAHQAVQPINDSNEDFHLVYTGRLSDLDKGILLLPDILRRVRDGGVDARLTVAGSGPDEQALREIFTQRGVSRFVDLRGNLTHDEVTGLLHHADAFILPSRFEGCPNALMEAMAAGCPSVAARIRGSVDQIIEHGKNGLLAEVADPESFASAVIELAKDPARRRSIGDAGRARIRDRFSLEAMAEGYARVFQALPGKADLRHSPLPLRHYAIPRALLPTWRTRIPAPLKNFARKWLERFGISS